MNPANDRRTHEPDIIRARIAQYAGFPEPKGISTGQRGIIVKTLNELCDGATYRRLLLRYLTGGESNGQLTEMSAKDLTGQQINGIWRWLGAHVPDREKDDPKHGKWEVRQGIPTEVNWLLAAMDGYECIENQMVLPNIEQPVKTKPPEAHIYCIAGIAESNLPKITRFALILIVQSATTWRITMIINGNALNIPLRSETVQCCITSPPYWGLRDYGTANWTGGNGSDCDHLADRFATPVSEKQASNKASGSKQARDVCPKCGARRVDLQLGLEPTPEAYVNNMVAVFREVWRVLKNDGILWLVIGDSWNGSGGAGGDYNKGGMKEGQPRYPGRNVPTLKKKDLVGIPWMLAFALRADGWFLRDEIIWYKPNPMPFPATDRTVRAHEQIFILSKSARYYFDYKAIEEPAKYGGDAARKARAKPNHKSKPTGKRAGIRPNAAHTFNRKVNETSKPGTKKQHRPDRELVNYVETRRKRAHFATFPPKLIEPMILAGSAEGDLVLDPFIGSGTVGVVATQYKRRWVGVELNPDYITLIRKRNEGVQVSLL